MAKGYQEIPNRIGKPLWLQSDTRLETRMFPAKLNPSSFRDRDSVKITVGSGGASISDTTIPITAITLPIGVNSIPKGTVIHFGGAKVAVLSAAYTSGSSLSVDAIPTALVAGDVAYFNPFPERIWVEAGTLVGRTYAERDAGTGFGPFAFGDDEVYLLGHHTPNALNNSDCYLLAHGAVLKQNFLPNWAVNSVLVDETQTVTIAGTLSGGVISFGDGNKSVNVAYNANLATVQAALDSIFGSSAVVASGTIASLTLVWSGSVVDDTDQPKIQVDISGCTGATSVTIAETVKGGNSWLQALRERYTLITGRA